MQGLGGSCWGYPRPAEASTSPFQLWPPLALLPGPRPAASGAGGAWKGRFWEQACFSPTGQPASVSGTPSSAPARGWKLLRAR